MKGLVYTVCAAASALPLLSALRLISPMLLASKLPSASIVDGRNNRQFCLKMSSFDTDDGVDDAIGAPIGPLPSVSR